MESEHCRRINGGDISRLVLGDPHSTPSFVSIPLNNLSMSSGPSGSVHHPILQLTECEHCISLLVRFLSHANINP